MAEQIKMLFWMNTPGGAWNVVIEGGADPPTEGERESGPRGLNGKIDITLQPIVRFG